MRVPETNLEQLAEHGYTIVEGFLEPERLRAAHDALWDVYPRPADYFADPDQHRRFSRSQFAGLRFFPYPSWDLNRIAVHPHLVDAAERYLRSSDLDLYKIELWAKYAGAVEYDQPLHRDYGNHTIVVPSLDGRHQQLTTFILLSDVTEDDAPTRLVPLEQSRTVPLVPRELPAGALAEHEIPITGPAGSLFLYRTDILHRASDFRGPHRSRFVMLVDFQQRGWRWTGKMAWPDRALYPGWVEAMERMSVRQRELFGFPPVGDAYWSEQTLRDTQARYPGMDMTPYQAT